MSIYDIKQNTLSEYIKEYLNEAYYIELKKYLLKIENEKNYENISNLIKEIILCIKSPKQLLNINIDVQSNFLNKLTINDHEIFKPIHTNINKINSLIEELKTPSPLCFSEDLKHYEVKSLNLAYRITSYDVSEHQFKKRDQNQTGNSIGSIMDKKVYFKLEHGGRLIMPAKEHAIYEFYKNLFPNSISALVSPTQLILMDNLKILNPESIKGTRRL
ncbi:hypothetical protein DICPUDRAFT_146554 [Dictyostelium purpureum]|uniref:Uncharacterized protein n=1 Tax=Dictyostelium purpureum TaxID=5786 RepID=F0Z696_DICPU|nr:uncharacterized protein DICPUDRAFT_146554 [Dictyostelium purpureum]EGC40616.1 hypothetical protein DICPUDRAFT_146554 [Dictyostelium purpureum]|eukprot:XP_003282952.1 hypothetical protein DICPUDRAFT_146554 [Dictyostelium purpureum]